MSLPSPEVLDDIKALITEITGFQESDENFEICQRYCLSHVVHHTYPFVNRTSVKNTIDSYESRFYGHGYFKVSRELNYQVKKYLENENLFAKNPQYDIQWCLLSLLSSLSSNLSLVKEVPKLLPVEDDESEAEEIDWQEYLTRDLPKQISLHETSSESDSSLEEEKEETENRNISKNSSLYDNKSQEKVVLQNKCQDEKKAELSLIYKKPEVEKVAQQRSTLIQELLNRKKYITNLENDYLLRGNFSEKLDALLCEEGFYRPSQYLTELKMMEYILHQFQTGEKILLKKGLIRPALISLTQNTLGNYLDSLQPYFEIIKSFTDFNKEILETKYPDLYRRKPYQNKTFKSFSLKSNCGERKISKVLYTYGEMLKAALDPFQNEIMEIANDLDSYSLITMQRKIEPYFFELTSLYSIHNEATKNWKNSANWLCSVRILSVLYNAIMNSATTVKMSFLYLNMFLQCFQVYLNITDTWISCLKLKDPTDEFIVTKSQDVKNQINGFNEKFEVRPYVKEMQNIGIKEVPILNFIARKMVQVGQSIEVLRRLNRFVFDGVKLESSSYEKLINIVNVEIDALGKVFPFQNQPRVKEKKKSIFTMKNLSVPPARDDGGGDCFEIGLLLQTLTEKEEPERNKVETSNVISKVKPGENYCSDFVWSTIKNPFFECAFENVGLKYELKKLNRMKSDLTREKSFSLFVVKRPDESKYAVYPFHKIISESCYKILQSQISSACTIVKDIVVKECHLKSHLALLRSLLLFNDSHLIQSFILGFFTQPTFWESSYSLTIHLKECLETPYKDFVSGLSVSMAKEPLIGRNNVLIAIDDLTINYEVSWPLTLIFTQNVMEKYNKVFRIALKLKWAHWILCNLQFHKEEDNKSNLARSIHHRLQLLRFWFLSTLNRINNYFMAQMSPLDLDFSFCNTLEEIINAHSNFIDKVFYHCLLSDKAPEMWSVLFETFIPLCMDLEKHWIKENVVAFSKLAEMEAIFGQCQLKLSRLMSSFENK